MPSGLVQYKCTKAHALRSTPANAICSSPNTLSVKFLFQLGGFGADNVIVASPNAPSAPQYLPVLQGIGIARGKARADVHHASLLPLASDHGNEGCLRASSQAHTRPALLCGQEETQPS